MTQNSELRMRITDGQIEDDLNPAQMAAEDCMLAMRTIYGIDSELHSRASELLPKLPDTLEKLVELGFAQACDGGYKPTEQGWLLGNEMFGRILELA